MSVPLLPIFSIGGPHLVSGDSLNRIVNYVKNIGPSVTTDDGGTTQTLTAAMVSNDGDDAVYHPSTGGSTPSLTLPLASAVIANIPNAVIGSSYVLRIINNNSGTATIVTNTGWTLTGTLTVATNTWREFVITVASATALTAVCVGTGTMS